MNGFKINLNSSTIELDLHYSNLIPHTETVAFSKLILVWHA